MEENKNVQDEQTVKDDAVNEDVTEEKPEQINETEADGKVSSKEKKKLKKAEEQIEELKAELEKQTGALEAANDKYMRLYAEYDNFRRRSQKEKEGIYSDAYIDALTQILPILDTLERAAQYADADAEHPLAKGLELTLKSFAQTLEKMGVSEIEALGKQFDPNVHNAVMHVDDENYGENEITEVFMKGYIKGDKVLRHSMVKVAN